DSAVVAIVLSILLPRPPGSQLFPYTTLFRSVLTPKDTLSIAYSVLTENQKKRFETESELDFSFGIQNLARGTGCCGFDSHPPERDRKSTRLNSSHVAISYAVFCLKKTKSVSA